MEQEDDLEPFEIRQKTQIDLIDHLDQHGISRESLAQLYADIIGDNPMDSDTPVDIICRKCGGQYLPERHELVEAFGYLYHDGCIPEKYDRTEREEDDTQ